MSAWRALGRWGWRTLRREWRQQLLVLTMITVAVAGGVFAVLAVFNLVPRAEETYGNGTMRFEHAGDDDDAVNELRDYFGAAGVIRDSSVPVSGSVERVSIRAQDPDDDLIAPLLGLVEGRWPAAPGEIALTDDVATLLDADIGTHVELDGRRRAVVGVVENPTDLDDEFALVPAGERPRAAPEATTLVAIVDTTREIAAGLHPPVEWGYQARWDELDDQTLAALAVYIVMAVAMLEVSLLAAAGFAVIGRRRLRQYGILGAAGGTERQIRQAAALNGFAVGVVGSAIGVALAVVGAVAALPQLESVVRHRIDLALPWWLIAPGVALATTAAVVAAWWPSRSLSRQPIVEALASRRPVTPPAARSALAGLMAAAAGSAALSLGFSQSQPLAAIGGLVVAVIGVLLLTPSLAKLIGRVAVSLPVAGRIAGRDLARHQGRSAAALASLVLALGIPVAMAVTTASVDASTADEPTNLPPNMAIAWLPNAARQSMIPIDGFDAGGGHAALDRIQAALPAATIVAIDVAIDPRGQVGQAEFQEGVRQEARWAIGASRISSSSDSDVTIGTYSIAWLATPQLLDVLGLEPALAESDAALLSRIDGPAHVGGDFDLTPEASTNPTKIAIPEYGSISDSWLTTSTLTANAWETTTAGWLIVAAEDLTGEQRAALHAAAGDDVDIETHRERPSSSTFRLIAALAGGALAIGIVAMSVGLIRSESTAQLRTLAAIGAPGGMRRTISAATAGMLALGGAALAVPGGYLALVAIMSDRSADFPFVVPWIALGIVVLGVPALAAAGAWLLGGREPPAQARTPLA